MRRKQNFSQLEADPLESEADVKQGSSGWKHVWEGFTYVYLPVLGKGRSQKRGNSQDAILHVNQSTNAFINNHVGGMEVTVKHPGIVEDLQAL